MEPNENTRETGGARAIPTVAHRHEKACIHGLSSCGQCSPIGTTPEGLTVAVEAFIERLLAHADHPKRQVGPCVYCIPCDVRLYQGDDPNAEPDPRDEPDPEDWIGWLPTEDEDRIPTECPTCGAYGACGYDAEGRALIHSLNDDDAESAVEEVVRG